MWNILHTFFVVTHGIYHYTKTASRSPPRRSQGWQHCARYASQGWEGMGGEKNWLANPEWEYHIPMMMDGYIPIGMLYMLYGIIYRI